MAMVTPKTIVITSLPSRTMSMMTTRPICVSSSNLPSVVTDGLGLDGEPKKRKRLTNLTADERMMRRKLKNRVAAQTARDRKKERMVYLEEILVEIETENKRLQQENDQLRRKTGTLAAENTQLRSKLGTENEIVIEVKKEHGSPESAALYPPPQQELIHAPSKPVTSLLSMILATSLMCSLGCWKNLPAAQRPLRRHKVRRLQSSRSLPHQLQSLHRHVWWGPQQQSWNPSMN